jgi:metallophosphoesterase superfamily enzyme
MKLNCDTEALGKVLLRKAGVKIKGSVADTLKEHFDVDLAASELYIMPSFNDFLGGRPINERRPRKEIGTESLIGPVLRSEAVDVDNAELYLLDGTYPGTLSQLRSL